LSATSAAFSVVVLDTIGDTCKHLYAGKRLTRRGVTDMAYRNIVVIIFASTTGF